MRGKRSLSIISLNVCSCIKADNRSSYGSFKPSSKLYVHFTASSKALLDKIAVVAGLICKLFSASRQALVNDSYCSFSFKNTKFIICSTFFRSFFSLLYLLCIVLLFLHYL